MNTKHKEKAAAFQQQVWDFGRYSEVAYNKGDFKQAAKWSQSRDTAIVSMNYYESLWLEELSK